MAPRGLVFAFGTAVLCSIMFQLRYLSCRQVDRVLDRPHADSPPGVHHGDLRSGRNSFGACLMTSDDNDLLEEWIAYHYVMLPLRTLVIGNDPRSKQSPLDVLQRWNGSSLQYWLWSDGDYTSQRDMAHIAKIQQKQGDHHRLKERQRHFIRACSLFLREQNQTWVSYVDTDEFVAINHFWEADDREFVSSTDATKGFPNMTVGDIVQVRKSIPRRTGLTIMDVIQSSSKQLTKFGPCHSMPRLLHGPLEDLKCGSSNNTTAAPLSLRQGFHNESSYKLTTLRFMQHTGKRNPMDSGFGKVFMDVSKMPTLDSSLPRNIHRPYFQECLAHPLIPMPEALFRVHHYIGSWERYSSRSNDTRRTKAMWERFAALNKGDSCDLKMDTWLDTFVRQMGLEKARYLLSMN